MPDSEHEKFLLRCATRGCRQVGVLTLVYCCDECADGGARAAHSPRCVTRTAQAERLRRAGSQLIRAAPEPAPQAARRRA